MCFSFSNHPFGAFVYQISWALIPCASLVRKLGGLWCRAEVSLPQDEITKL